MIKDPEWACCDWPGRGIRAEKEVERLRAVNAQLVEALQMSTVHLDMMLAGLETHATDGNEMVRKAISKLVCDGKAALEAAEEAER